MFTGIITDIGQVRSVLRGGDARIEIATSYDAGTIAVGASICCSGACMTVIDKGRGWFAVSASEETLSCTTMGGWAQGSRINLERSLKVGDELGGHIVSGHVDGVARLESVTPQGDSLRLVFQAPETLKLFIAAKGSVAVDGVSLTINEVDGRNFGVNIIPHTREHTTLGRLAAGDKVNLEIDMLARYVARLLDRK
ncbi:MAG: riboflavin synthase subunit alpha [Rhodospirillales bacterium RIFCSPLOWO2_12_FULL_58_28]|nr:MAG: riboflavin synthase subunit alpha [Rhodospirillales bacterium RIFCSPLOWO2_02_FULL_58_16]OHC79044.1 MAG: riboflavin synthase subunit alpha [Rhodospirillales bacterium RIFCSPLOWO2_12_FULL_58_28]